MKNKPAVLGLAVPFVLLVCIGGSLLLSPWFSWGSGALSELGDPANSAAHLLFNSGLFASGIMLVAYSAKTLRIQARKTSLLTGASGLLLSMVGIFNLSFGYLHTVLAYLFFLLMWLASILYFSERRARLALLGAAFALVWAAGASGLAVMSTAAEEVLFFFFVLPWLAWSAVEMLRA